MHVILNNSNNSVTKTSLKISYIKKHEKDLTKDLIEILLLDNKTQDPHYS